MTNTCRRALFVILAVVAASPAFSMGDSRLRVKVDMKQLSATKKVAIVAFTGNSIITGNMGMGSLLTGVLSAKADSGNKLALNAAYMGTIYDMFTNTLKNEGYTFIPVETVVSAKAYQDATAISMPSYIDGKGLKQMNADKPDALKKLAAEIGADLFFYVTSSHSLGMRNNIGNVAGKQVGVASTMILVYDASGKKLGFIDASEISNKSVGAVAGGFSDPTQVMPLMEDADQQLISKLAAKISLKK